jgi:hypothetical protein
MNNFGNLTQQNPSSGILPVTVQGGNNSDFKSSFSNNRSPN